MKLSSAFLLLTLTSTAVITQAQGPGSGNSGNSTAGQVAALEAAVADLQGRVAKLEGNITQADLVGTYVGAFLDIPMEAFIPQQRMASIQTDGATMTMVLNADQSASLVFDGCSIRLTLGNGALSDLGCGQEGPLPGTWSYANGILDVNFGEFEGPFNVGVGGRLLTTAFATFHASDQASDTVLVILSRLQ